MLKSKYLRNTVTAFTLAGMMYLGSTPIYAELGDQELKKGMRHDDIKTLQQNLTDLGFFDYDGLTTYYGVHTEEAVKEFQTKAELEPNGIFDKATYLAMLNATNPTDSVESVDNIETSTESQEETNKESEEDADKYKLIVDRSLKLGHSGLDVKALQDVLKALGYLKIDNTTEYFGEQTETSLKVFQENLGLEVDGSAGPQTIDALNRLMIRKGLRVSMPNRSSLGRQTLGDQIISTAKKYIGVRYRYGGTTANGFDCSGYTQFIYKQHNISVPRDTRSQASTGTKLSKSELQTGDLVIFSNTYRRGPSHTGIYIGNGQFIHASTSKGVRIDDLDSAYWSKHYSYGRRVF
ncbi:MAG: NlpC/P60 family protein [Tissierellaceae bacterium]|nr:NlpC/P60 family protein [Tissierellaceae bacterium]